MNLHKLIFTENACYKAGRTIEVKGIMVHSTGANNPTLRRYVGPNDGLLGENTYGNHWNQPMDRNVCVHAFIGKLADGTIATYQTLPWNHRGWHAGGAANNTHIGFEICEDGLTDGEYFAKVYKEAVELCVYLCKEYNLTEKDIICHSEGHKQGVASNHGDVMHWFPKHGKSMDTFRADVKALLNAEDDTKEYDPEEILYRVQVGAYSVKANAEAMLAKLKAAGFDGFIVEAAKKPEAEKVEEAPAVTGTPSTGTDADAKVIWNYFKGQGLTEEGVAGLMGNLYAESALRSTNLQQTYEKKLGYTDESYTAAVDKGTYDNFVRDSAGYGLAQWTYWSRKEALLKYAQAAGKSIGDFQTQLDFLWKELQGYKTVLSVLKTATSIREASDAVLTGFERPADQSESVQVKRAEFGRKYFEKFSEKPEAKPNTPAKTIEEIAREVINGKWGNGQERKNRLTAAGYDYAEVQKRVNEILKK